jgi:hypothetical protein
MREAAEEAVRARLGEVVEVVCAQRSPGTWHCEALRADGTEWEGWLSFAEVLEGVGSGPLPDWLEGPLDAVLRDLQRPEPVVFAIRWEEPAADGQPGTLWFAEVELGTGGFGISLHPWLDPEEQKATIAERLQDEYGETGGAWAEARPACQPGHAHPAMAEIRDGRAVWRCPRDGRVVAPVGEV